MINYGVVFHLSTPPRRDPFFSSWSNDATNNSLIFFLLLLRCTFVIFQPGTVKSKATDMTSRPEHRLIWHQKWSLTALPVPFSCIGVTPLSPLTLLGLPWHFWRCHFGGTIHHERRERREIIKQWKQLQFKSWVAALTGSNSCQVPGWFLGMRDIIFII